MTRGDLTFLHSLCPPLCWPVSLAGGQFEAMTSMIYKCDKLGNLK